MNNLVYKIGAGVLILSVIFLQTAMTACAVQPTSAGNAERITKHAPELLVSPEVSTPGEKEGKRSYTWLWIALGVVAVGAAAAGGGGGGGGGSSSGSSTGSLSIGW
jgi:uncharacterized membrane protein YgcG